MNGHPGSLTPNKNTSYSCHKGDIENTNVDKDKHKSIYITRKKKYLLRDYINI